MPCGLESLFRELLLSFLKVLELRNPYNIGHCQLAARYCDLVAAEMGLPADRRLCVKSAAEIHTIGVLLQMEEKQAECELPICALGGRTGREESIFEREHQILRRLASELPSLEGCLEILSQRDEWYDGSFSPLGLAGEQILPEARLLAVVDAYVCLVTPKAHRPAETQADAFRCLRRLAGNQFDPAVVEALERALGDQGAEAQMHLRRFDEGYCRYYLHQGHFYKQIHETEWSLRYYLAAERMAVRIGCSSLELGAISGHFMVLCEQMQLGRAREVLQDFRRRGRTPQDQFGYQLLWGILEWLEGSPLGKQILCHLVFQYEKEGNLPQLTTALAFQACMTLFMLGENDGEHLSWLSRFLAIVGRHDVFDVVERYRPYTIPLLLNAIMRDLGPGGLARTLLARMGEPCNFLLLERLQDVHPTEWSKRLMSEPLLEALPPPPLGQSLEPYLELETLGHFSVRCGENAVGAEGFQTLKCLKVFVRLALHRGQPIGGDALAEEFWPEAGLKKMRDSLRNGLAQIRRTVRALLDDEEPEVVSRDRKSDMIVLGTPCRFDYERFEAAVRAAQKAVLEGDYTRGRALAEESLLKYRGEFLEGFDEEWALAIRSRLFSLKTLCQTLLVRCHLHFRDFAAAEEGARALLRLDDLREESHGLLLEALVQDGRSAEAVAHFEQTRRLFDEEIGVLPTRIQESLVRLGLLT